MKKKKKRRRNNKELIRWKKDEINQYYNPSYSEQCYHQSQVHRLINALWTTLTILQSIISTSNTYPFGTRNAPQRVESVDLFHRQLDPSSQVQRQAPIEPWGVWPQCGGQIVLVGDSFWLSTSTSIWGVSSGWVENVVTFRTAPGLPPVIVINSPTGPGIVANGCETWSQTWATRTVNPGTEVVQNRIFSDAVRDGDVGWESRNGL